MKECLDSLIEASKSDKDAINTSVSSVSSTDENNTEPFPPCFKKHPLIPFLQQEINTLNLNEFSEFEQLINQILFSFISNIKGFSKLKHEKIDKARTKILEIALQDIMKDYQRLTNSEIIKFDTKYGTLMNQANRALYSSYGDETTGINFRNINVDHLLQLS